MNMNYLFENKKNGLMLTIGVIITSDGLATQTCEFDLKEFNESLNNSKECLLDYIELNGCSEVDDYNKKQFIKLLKQYNKKYEYVGKLNFDN